MTKLEPLNTMRFFCECQLGEKGNCPGVHVTTELQTPGSNLRAMLIVAAMGMVAVIVFLMAAHS